MTSKKNEIELIMDNGKLIIYNGQVLPSIDNLKKILSYLLLFRVGNSVNYQLLNSCGKWTRPPARKNNWKRSSWKLIIHFPLFIINYSLLTSCGIYSFSGTTLSPDLKTVSIINFTMNAAGGPANLPTQFNEKMKEYYQRNTNLKLLPTNGDLQLEGSITGYEVTPVAPTSQDQAAFNRLTVTVQVKFSNVKDETKNFDQNFSFFKDFPQGQTLSQNEKRLIDEIFDQIVQDIFNKSAGDW